MENDKINPAGMMTLYQRGPLANIELAIPPNARPRSSVAIIKLVDVYAVFND